MKKILNLCQFLIIFGSLQIFICTNALAQNPGHAVLKGNIKGNKGEGFTLYRPDEISALINYKDGQFIPTDSSGNFYTNIILDKATYFDIGFNTLYISPHDSII